jgi:SAM-dependent methyltransferase
MKKWLQDYLVCPECLPREIPLDLNPHEELNHDVIEGDLTCSGCGKHYPIRNGVAVILSEQSKQVLAEGLGYNSRTMLSAYLWSHFCDLLHDPAATDAYQLWASFFKKTDGLALDIGCAVGRLSFELSKTHARVIGIDTSFSFIQNARTLLAQKRLSFDLIFEGLITKNRSCELSSDWNHDRIDFIVADALALPFPKSLFSTVSSVNILEKVSDPIVHLKEVNRVLREGDAMFVFSDPFSWDETVLAPEFWIGGKNGGKYNGRGIDCMSRIFSGEDMIFDPPLKITKKGNVSWKIRKTENLWEHIKSQFLVGIRQ